MRIWNSHHIDHQGHGKNGAAAAEQAEGEAHKAAGKCAKFVLKEFQIHVEARAVQVACVI